GILVAGGSVTLYGDTLNANAARGGAGGLGGHGGSGPLAVVFGSGLGISTGGFGGLSGLSGFSGLGGASGINSGGRGGSGGSGGAVIQGAGKLTASSSVFAAKASSDYSGNFSATNSLFQAAPINGALSGSDNSVGSNPLLDSNGLQNNGGATATVALKTGSPAI